MTTNLEESQISEESTAVPYGANFLVLGFIILVLVIVLVSFAVFKTSNNTLSKSVKSRSSETQPVQSISLLLVCNINNQFTLKVVF